MVLFKLEPTLIMLMDCLKYLLLPKLTEAANLEFAGGLSILAMRPLNIIQISLRIIRETFFSQRLGSHI